MENNKNLKDEAKIILERIKDKKPATEELKGLYEELKKDGSVFKEYAEGLESKYNLEDSIPLEEIDFSNITGKIYEPSEKKDSSSYKLLYAMAWKNGDLGKEEHIVKGIEDGKNPNAPYPDPTKIPVDFYQFGRYLATKDSEKIEPIADKHTFRAYVYMMSGEVEEFKDDIEKGAKEKYWVSYIDWYKERATSKESFKYLNLIMFAIGKALSAD